MTGREIGAFIGAAIGRRLDQMFTGFMVGLGIWLALDWLGLPGGAP